MANSSIDFTTDKTTTDRTHAKITGFEVNGLGPGETTTIKICWVHVYDNDPPNKDWVATHAYEHTLTGATADTFLTASTPEYEDFREDCLQKLLDDAKEVGALVA